MSPLPKGRHDVGKAAVGGIIAIIGLLSLIRALAPPAMDDWDGLAYHLAIPKLYLSAHRIYYIDFSSHSNFPFTVEMLYALGLALRGAAMAKLFHFAYGVVAAAAVYLTARRYFGTRSARFAVLLFAGMPIVAWEATVAYIDLAAAAYTILPAAAILAYSETQDRRWLLLGSICAGLGAATKMTGLAAAAVFAIWTGIEGCRAGDIENTKMRLFSGLRRALLFGIIAVAIASPWYIKSFIYTGNPVYPFFYETFGGRNWNAEIAENYRRLQQEFGMGHGLADFLRLPWDLAFHPERFYDRPGLHIGPAFLAVLPIAGIGALRDRRVLKVILLCLVFTAIWFEMSQQSRYLIPTFGIAAIACAGALSAACGLKLARAAAIAAASLSIILSIMIMRDMLMLSGRAAVGAERPADFLSRTVDIYRAEKWINENTPSQSKVILYGDTRGFYLDRDYLWGDWGHSTLIPYEKLRDTAAFVQALRGRGITHALVKLGILEKDGQYIRLIGEAIAAGSFRQVYRDSRFPVAVFEVRGPK